MEGEKGWHTSLQNWEDETQGSVNEVTLTLDSELEFDYMNPDPNLTNPSTWLFGTVDQGADVYANVGSDSGTFTPGFDASRSIVDNKTVFLQSEGTQTQTMDITVTPQLVEEPSMFDIHVDTGDYPLVNVLINSVSTSEGYDTQVFWNERHAHITVKDPSFGDTFTATVEIQVTPNVPKVEFIPRVEIGRSPFTPLYTTTDNLIVLTTEIGTWTWDSEGSYEWLVHANEVIGYSLTWQPLYRDLTNTAGSSYSTWRIYTAPENTFDNREVTGNTWWQAGQWNQPDTTEDPIAGLELSLDTDLALDWYPFGTPPTLVTEGPPTYQWAFGDVAEAEDEERNFFVHPKNPADDVLGSFTPGFNASVSVDRVKFLQSEGAQEQTLTLTVEKVDPAAHFILLFLTDELPGSSLPFLSVDKDDLVEAAITSSFSFPEWTDVVFPGRTGFIMDTMHIPAGETWTCEVPIEVTPKVPSVEYKPVVFLTSQDPYPERQSHVGNSHSFEVDSLGTWTWSAEGEYDWQWRCVDRGAVVFPGIPPAIEDFAIKHMSIDFDRRANNDKIAITEATFSLREDATYDLAVDDVTVSIDGLDITMPAGSFIKAGNNEKYTFVSPEGVEPKVKMTLDFDKGEWSFKVSKIDASAIDNYDGVDVAFCIGYMAAIERINMQIGGLSYIAEY